MGWGMLSPWGWLGVQGWKDTQTEGQTGLCGSRSLPCPWLKSPGVQLQLQWEAGGGGCDLQGPALSLLSSAAQGVPRFPGDALPMNSRSSPFQ